MDEILALLQHCRLIRSRGPSMASSYFSVRHLEEREEREERRGEERVEGREDFYQLARAANVQSQG